MTTDWHGLVKTDTFELLLWREWNTGDYRLWLRFDGNPNWHAIAPIPGAKWYWNQQRKISLSSQLNSGNPRLVVRGSQRATVSRHRYDLDDLDDPEVDEGVLATGFNATDSMGEVLLGAGLYTANGWFDDVGLVSLGE